MEIDSLEERVARLFAHMEEKLETWIARKPMVRALMALRGFQVVTAMTTVAELGDLDRFDSPRQLMGYLGIVPGEDSSGAKRRQGSITKTGNSHVRWMLAESANAYESKSMVSPALSKRQDGQSRAVKELSWRAQERLCYRRRRLSARKLPRNKVTIAIARELCAFIWELDAIIRKKPPPATRGQRPGSAVPQPEPFRRPTTIPADPRRFPDGKYLQGFQKKSSCSTNKTTTAETEPRTMRTDPGGNAQQ